MWNTDKKIVYYDGLLTKTNDKQHVSVLAKNIRHHINRPCLIKDTYMHIDPVKTRLFSTVVKNTTCKWNQNILETLYRWQIEHSNEIKGIPTYVYLHRILQILQNYTEY